ARLAPGEGVRAPLQESLQTKQEEAPATACVRRQERKTCRLPDFQKRGCQNKDDNRWRRRRGWRSNSRSSPALSAPFLFHLWQGGITRPKMRNPALCWSLENRWTRTP